jgi:protein-tyrosine kinase
MVVERLQRAIDLARQQRVVAQSGVTVAEREAVVAQVSAGNRPENNEPVSKDRTGLKSIAIDRDAARKRRVVFPDDTGAAAAAYRMLRTQLLQQTRKHELRTIGLVSAADGEGKTLTAINLALSLAADPTQSVALLDCDFHKPGIARTLGIDVQTGLDAWYACAAPFEKLALSVADFERLVVLPASPSVAYSPEMLAVPRTAELIAELKRRDAGRLNVVDLPPVLLREDALAIAHLLDGVLLVVSERRTRRDDIVRMLELLGPARVIGTVLNDSASAELRAY